MSCVSSQLCSFTYKQAFCVDGVDPLLEYGPHRRSSLEPVGVAVSFLASKLSISEDTIRFRTSAQERVANYTFLVRKIVCQFPDRDDKKKPDSEWSARRQRGW